MTGKLLIIPKRRPQQLVQNQKAYWYNASKKDKKDKECEYLKHLFFTTTHCQQIVLNQKLFIMPGIWKEGWKSWQIHLIYNPMQNILGIYFFHWKSQFEEKV